MNNMMKTSEAKIKHFDGEDYTCITFQPDLSKFKMEKLDKDIVALMTRRAYDLAGSCKGVKVMFNGKKLPVSVLENILIVLLFCRLVSSCFLNLV
jgi:DNA topoisomerase-2